MKNLPPQGDPNALDQYAGHTAAVTKNLLNQLKEERKLGKDGLYWYGE